ncbi:MAG: YihY/virulence factor BrkB family protein [Bacteroidales bacterium]
MKNRLNKLKTKILRNTFVRKSIILSRRLVLPGFQGVPFYYVMKFFIESLVKGVLFQRAAAMTYRIFIAIIPMIIAFFSMISFLGEGIKNTIFSFIESLVPAYTWPAVSGVITEVIMRQNGTLFYFFFIFGLYFSIICINSLLNTLNATYFEVETRNFFKQLLVSLGILILFSIILVLVVAIFIAASMIINYLDRHLFDNMSIYLQAVYLLKWLFIFLLIYLLISIFYYWAPAQKKNFKFFSAGSSLATISMVILLFCLNIYFADFSNYNLIYGSMGALFAILLWLYFNSLIILIGFDLNVSIAMAHAQKKRNDKMVLESYAKKEVM